MPELPEVETVMRTLSPHALNHVFTKVNLLHSPTLHPLSLDLGELQGRRVTGLRRRGKLLIMDLDKGMRGAGAPEVLIFHLRMTGRILTRSANELSGRHTRCVFGLKDEATRETQLFFDDTRAFGKIMAATSTILDKWPFWRNLGPEPLEMDGGGLATRLRGTRAIKTALLDQAVIAGIGNIYADEALFRAGINPQRGAGSLSRKECGRLMKAIQKVLRESIAKCGSSISDYLDAEGNAGAFQNCFAVYGRGGEKCRKCGAILRKIRLGGRSTVYCPRCQPTVSANG